MEATADERTTARGGDCGLRRGAVAEHGPRRRHADGAPPRRACGERRGDARPAGDAAARRAHDQPRPAAGSCDRAIRRLPAGAALGARRQRGQHQHQLQQHHQYQPLLAATAPGAAGVATAAAAAIPRPTALVVPTSSAHPLPQAVAVSIGPPQLPMSPHIRELLAPPLPAGSHHHLPSVHSLGQVRAAPTPTQLPSLSWQSTAAGVGAPKMFPDGSGQDHEVEMPTLLG